ncbi:MAG: hypothetical protein ACPLPS_11020 [bacterium]
MKIEEFRELVKREFGPRLEHATPANVQDFITSIYAGLSRKREGRFEIEEKASSYEEIVKEFLSYVLEHPSDEAIVLLWLLALELLFAVIEPLERERIGKFLNNLPEDI